VITLPMGAHLAMFRGDLKRGPRISTTSRLGLITMFGVREHQNGFQLSLE